MSESIICRLCANSCYDFQSLYYNNGRPNGIYEIMFDLFHPKFVDMEAAKHLTSICHRCFRYIYDFHSFQINIMMAQLELVDNITKEGGINPLEKKENEVEDEGEHSKDIGNIESDDNDAKVSMHSDSVNHKTNKTTKETFCESKLEDFADAKANKQTNMLKCRLCPKRLSCFQRLRRHYRQSHPGIGPSLLDSSYDPLTKRFKCKLCSKTFPLKSILVSHLHLRHGHKAKSIPTAINRHKKQQHPGIQLSMLSSSYDLSTQCYKCIYCAKIFSTHCNLLSHVKCHVDNKTLTETTEQNNELIDSTGQVEVEQAEVGVFYKKFIKCKKCDVDFESEVSWQNHFKTAHPDCKSDISAAAKKFMCRICNRSFSTMGNLVFHVKAQHKIAYNKRNQCDVCGISYAFQKNLRKHMKRKHMFTTIDIDLDSDKTVGNASASNLAAGKKFTPSIKSFKCHICVRSFLFESSLKNHIERQHGRLSDNKQFSCPLCNKLFKTNIYLTLHMERQHLEVRDFCYDETTKVFTCKLCEKSCTRWVDAMIHLTLEHGKISNAQNAFEECTNQGDENSKDCTDSAT